MAQVQSLIRKVRCYKPCNVRRKKKTRKKTTNKTEVNNLPEGFPGGAVVKNLPASAGDTGSSPGPGRSHMPWSN